MKMLEDRIRKDGIVREGNVLKVDSFINHQMDIPLFREMAKEWKRLFAGKPINKVLTIEASGIGIAAVGMIVKACWITCPKWFSSVIYIGMGWLCVLAFVPIFHNLPRAGFGWLLAGGIIYTIGGVIYALKLPIFNAKHKFFGSHEVFHLFVMGGSVCHFIFMYLYVA